MRDMPMPGLQMQDMQMQGMPMPGFPPMSTDCCLCIAYTEHGFNNKGSEKFEPLL